MYRNRILVLVVVVLLASSAAWSTSLDEARQLHETGRTEEALAAIESLMGSDASGDEKAAALDLLGTIAVDKGYLPMAKQAWAQLKDEYPDYAADNDVGTKLLLVSALLKEKDSAAPAIAAKEPVAALAPEAAEPTAAEAPTEAAEPAMAPAPASPAAPKAESPPIAAPRESSGVVLVAIRGKPYDAAQEAGERVKLFLRDRGVDAQSATGGIPVVADSKMVLPLLLQKGQTEGADSVVLLTADFASMQKIVMDCHLPEGAELWKVKTSGGTGWKGRAYSKTGINEELVERFIEKLEKKIGGPGLPVTLK